MAMSLSGPMLDSVGRNGRGNVVVVVVVMMKLDEFPYRHLSKG